LLEYSPSGAQIERFGAGQITDEHRDQALAFSDLSNALYVVDPFRGQVFSLPAPGPLATIGSLQASEVHKTAATLDATVDPEGAATTYSFQYITEERYLEDGQTFGAGAIATATSGAIGEDFGEYRVSVPVNGLAPETTYRFRLIAFNANGTNETEVGTFATLPPVRIDATSASNISSTAATLNAQIDPLGEAATYQFEYLTEAAYLENEKSFSGPQAPINVPSAAEALGSGEADVEVTQHVQNLLPHTTYRYRVVAFDGVAPNGIPGPVLTFATQSSQGPLILPDGRQWEMVTPPDKFGAEIVGVGDGFGVTQASSSGGAITYLATAPTERQAAGNSNLTQVLSLRGPSGWGTKDIAIPHSEAVSLTNEYTEYPYFSEDLSLGVLQPFRAFNPWLSADASEQTAYLRANYLHADTGIRCEESCYRPLVTSAPNVADIEEGTEFGVCEGGTCKYLTSQRCPPAFLCGPQFEAASPDLGHVVVRSQVALTPETPSSATRFIEHSDLYEWSAGKLAYIGEGSVGNIEKEPEESAGRNAVSEDGSRVVIDGESEGLRGLLERDTNLKETVKLDAVKGGSGAGNPEPIFQIASSDGSKVFFIDTQRLTVDSGADNESPDLYECEVKEVEGELKCDLTDLTPAHAGESGGIEAPILGASADGSYVYFVATGILTGAQETQYGEKAQSGQPNLYLTHDGRVQLIAVLSPEDSPDWGNGHGDSAKVIFKPAAGLEETTSRISPDGRWLAFMSERSLTGYVNSDAASGLPDEEVYLFHTSLDSGTGVLACVSCNPTGARPDGVEVSRARKFGPTGMGSTWNKGRWLAANIPGWTSWLHQSRYLSDSGRLFFNSFDGLVAQDTNGTSDVYEYEPPGVGDCTETSQTFDSASDGCVGLLSSGTSPEESGFLEASSRGGDVFLLTHAELTSEDFDTAMDVYDAHQCDASAPCFPAPAVPPPACEGDACQTPASPPDDPSPGSLTFSGPGNPIVSSLASKPKQKSKTVKCRKGATKRKGACEKHRHRTKAIKNVRRNKATAGKSAGRSK
jgi:hypothetical protein